MHQNKLCQYAQKQNNDAVRYAEIIPQRKTSIDFETGI